MQLGVLYSSAFNQNIIHWPILIATLIGLSLLACFYDTHFLSPPQRTYHSVCKYVALLHIKPPSTRISPCSVFPSSSYMISCNISHAITVKRPRPLLAKKESLNLSHYDCSSLFCNRQTKFIICPSYRLKHFQSYQHR